jgi:hypothetical protein
MWLSALCTRLLVLGAQRETARSGSSILCQRSAAVIVAECGMLQLRQDDDHRVP